MGKLLAVASSRAALLSLMTLVSCSFNRGAADVTTVVFDGQTQTISGQLSCTAQPDGKLLILALDGQNMVRVLLRREHQLVVEKVGLRIHDARGFTDNSDEVWANKVDDAYTINGRMPPNAGEVAEHQFKIETRCRYEVPLPPPPPENGGGHP